MSEKYLFVAEADKIQDLIFRSSKLREVSGGSQMLSEFCEVSKELAKKFNGEVIISSGGSFRIQFDSKKKAEEFGEYLSELYRRELGGTITVADPVKVCSENKAIKKGQENLRKAKHSGKLPVSMEQMPYMAICASCGVGVARYYKKRYEDEDKNYLCEICEKKSLAKARIREKFLSDFYSYVMNSDQTDIDFPKDAEQIAKLESRSYVAYLVADVNNMGVVFSYCDNFDELKRLSENLSKVIQQSLAEPTKILIDKHGDFIKERLKSDIIPILPLIMGGDDVFALIPAQWSLDFALRFCQEFETRMKESLKEINFDPSLQPTISASVIICKGKFPYLIAHNLGEELLKIAKRRSKEEKKSMISFKVITGNEIVRAPEEKKIFVAGFPTYSIEELKKLIEYRFTLKDLPGTRRAQLESLFYKAEELQKKYAFQRMKSEWLPELEKIISRLKTSQKENLTKALLELGDLNNNKEYYWQFKDGSYYHKLPDLLSAWDFAYDLEKEVSEYEEEEE
ncbi:hypothetical protein JCM12298_31150 [Desulfothermus naphthae]